MCAVSNVGECQAVEAAIEACSNSEQTHGGNGNAREYQAGLRGAELWLQECQLFRLAPVTQQMTPVDAKNRLLMMIAEYESSLFNAIVTSIPETKYKIELLKEIIDLDNKKIKWCIKQAIEV